MVHKWCTRTLTRVRAGPWRWDHRGRQKKAVLPRFYEFFDTLRFGRQSIQRQVSESPCLSVSRIDRRKLLFFNGLRRFFTSRCPSPRGSDRGRIRTRRARIVPFSRSRKPSISPGGCLGPEEFAAPQRRSRETWFSALREQKPKRTGIQKLQLPLNSGGHTNGR